MKFSTRFIPAFVAAFSLVASFAAAAVEVDCQAGGLKAAVEEAGVDAATETSLTVTGSVNALDFDFIRSMTALKQLDLSGATVAAYSGSATETGASSSKANALPAYSLMSGRFTEFSFPEGITEIGSGALGNSNVEKLVIPSTVTTIDAGAFANMENLTEVTIPSSVTSLPSMLFKDCQKLQKATVDADVATLPESFFRNCPALTAVSLPSSLTAIGDYAFSGCSSLTTIALPSNLQTIGNYAFASCTSLEGLTTPAALTTVGDWAFSGCTDLKSITFGSPVTTFGTGAFYNATSLATPLNEIAAATTELPDYMLYNAASVDASNFSSTTVETVGTRALSGNGSIATTLPASLKSLGDNAMEDWTNLQKIEAYELAEVPELGSSVWEGVDQGSVILSVPAGMMNAYKDAPQWQDFNIQELAVSDIVLTDGDANAANLRAAFDGALLRLEADSDIRAAQLYDITGRCLTIVNNTQSNRLTIDTTPYSVSVFLVRVLIDGVATPTLKLAR